MRMKRPDLEPFFTHPLGMMGLVDLNGDFIKLNPGWKDCLGYELEDIQARPLTHFVHCDDQKTTELKFQFLSNHEFESVDFENRFLHKSGEWRWLHWSGVRVGELVYFAARDLTDQKNTHAQLEKTQTQLMRNAKLASLGELAGGIAHEINNPLAVILTSTTLMRAIFDKEPRLKDPRLVSAVDSIENTVNRITNIVDGMKKLLRHEETVKVPCEMSAIVRTSFMLCADRMNSCGIRHELNLVDCVFVFGNQTQLSQVFVNLINNAIDAVKGEQEAWIRIDLEKGLEKVRFSVTDSGEPVPEEMRGRIFEPFYTSKEVGKGTGLGLSISREIVRQHGGEIYLNGQASYTQFVVELPMGTIKKRKVS